MMCLNLKVNFCMKTTSSGKLAKKWSVLSSQPRSLLSTASQKYLCIDACVTKKQGA